MNSYSPEKSLLKNGSKFQFSLNANRILSLARTTTISTPSRTIKMQSRRIHCPFLAYRHRQSSVTLMATSLVS
jgi:hypothetical protein